jgi:hypothetical protein
MTLGAVSFGLSVLQWLLLGDVCFRSSTELLSTSSFRVQLIGKVDPHSMDWCDGVLTTALRGDDRLGSRVCPFVLDAGMSLSSLAALRAASSPPTEHATLEEDDGGDYVEGIDKLDALRQHWVILDGPSPPGLDDLMSTVGLRQICPHFSNSYTKLVVRL